MPDPSVSEALAEAMALAPSEEIIHHTMELAHPAFVDGAGNPDSAWFVADQRDLMATLEAGAPIRPSQLVTFVAIPFRFHLPQIEPGATPEIKISIDGVSRDVAQQIDRAIGDPSPIVMRYRPYLSSDLSAPQMSPTPSFELSDVMIGLLTVTATARTGIDLRIAFPRRIFSAAEFPALIGR